jgi:hypothetical protein
LERPLKRRVRDEVKARAGNIRSLCQTRRRFRRFRQSNPKWNFQFETRGLSAIQSLHEASSLSGLGLGCTSVEWKRAAPNAIGRHEQFFSASGVARSAWTTTREMIREWRLICRRGPPTCRDRIGRQASAASAKWTLQLAST